jgi:nucleoid-associated protein YgaU
MKNLIVSALAVAGLAFAGVAGAEDPDSGPDDPAYEQRMEPGEPGTAPEEGRRQGERETPPVEAQPPRGSESVEEYVVKEGDTLASIAERHLGSPHEWKRIAEANGIEEPEDLQAGRRLQIPTRDTKHQAEGH